MTDPTFKTVDLDTPITRGEQTIGMVQLRKPRSGELRGLSLVSLGQLEVDEVRKLLPRITTPTLTVADVDALDPADLLSLGAEIADFLLPKRAKADSPTASTN